MYKRQAHSSVLASGIWFKIPVTEDNIYRIDYSTLKKIGLEFPSNPRIFGNNHGQLSFYNDGSHPDDLEEIAIFTNTGSDGIFNEGDYLLFYGKGTGRWLYDHSSDEFSHQRHYYSDTAFYLSLIHISRPGPVLCSAPMATSKLSLIHI